MAESEKIPKCDDRLHKLVAELGSFLKTDGSILVCTYCVRTINSDKKTRVIRHLATKKHRANAAKNRSQFDKQTDLQSEETKLKQFRSTKQARFNAELCEAFLAAQIPFWKLTNPVLKNFLTKYTNMVIPDESTLRKRYKPKLAKKL